MANANTMTKISTVTVGSGGAATIDFTSIPATYTDIVIKYSGRSTAAGNYQNVNIKINTDTGSNYTSKLLYGDGSAAGSDTTTTTFLKFMYIPFSSATASVFGSGELYFAKYAGSIYKSMIADTVTENNATGSGSSIIGLAAGLWSSNSVINAITLTPNSGSWAEHSTASLYGINATTATTALATGGTITYNGGYVYHTFLNSGTFTPAQSLITECLIIAGGGGSAYNGSGGGGAGGLVYQNTTLTAQNYTIVIGGGGSAGSNTGRGGNGSDTTMTGQTTAVGGGGGAATGSAGNGGSGGGNYLTSDAGTGTSGQGFNGAVGVNSGYYNSGGGGGASATGYTLSGGSDPNGGKGGAGSNAYSTWASATSTGVSGYYAGGGTGGSNTLSATTGGAGGGGTGGTNANVTGGTANSGGGAGGDNGNQNTSTRTGGSGIVIVRYVV